jgi:endonuclease III
MRKDELLKICCDYFESAIPVAETELHFNSSYELLVSVILSAQCTDKRVNMITPALFKYFPSVAYLAQATPDEVFEKIKSVSYPNAKSIHLVNMAKMVMENFNGEIPHTIEELITLPGVGRKTANVMLAVAFAGQAMPVDTHVFRVSHRIGLVSDKCNTPLCVEKELVRFFPYSILSKAHHWLILHGRYTCTAKYPKCEKCGLNIVCKYFKENSTTR